MIEFSPPISETRRKVRQVCAYDIGSRILDLNTLDSLSLDELKMLQYALMVKPLSAALASFIDKPQPLTSEPEAKSRKQLIHLVGFGVAKESWQAMQKDQHLALIDDLCERRAEKMEPKDAEGVYPLADTLVAGALSSAESMLDAAIANALTIQAAGAEKHRPRQDFINSIKRSIQLPLSRPMTHFVWHSPIRRSLQEHNDFYIEDDLAGVPNLDTLAYDLNQDRAVMKRDFEDWYVSAQDAAVIQEAAMQQGIPVDLQHRIGQLAAVDIEVGCPVSFSPKLVRRYYERVVDLIEFYRAWPNRLLPHGERRAHLDVLGGLATNASRA